jgi:hypothetical protein
MTVLKEGVGNHFIAFMTTSGGSFACGAEEPCCSPLGKIGPARENRSIDALTNGIRS